MTGKGKGAYPPSGPVCRGGGRSGAMHRSFSGSPSSACSKDLVPVDTCSSLSPHIQTVVSQHTAAFSASLGRSMMTAVIPSASTVASPALPPSANSLAVSDVSPPAPVSVSEPSGKTSKGRSVASRQSAAGTGASTLPQESDLPPSGGVRQPDEPPRRGFQQARDRRPSMSQEAAYPGTTTTRAQAQGLVAAARASNLGDGSVPPYCRGSAAPSADAQAHRACPPAASAGNVHPHRHPVRDGPCRVVPPASGVESRGGQPRRGVSNASKAGALQSPPVRSCSDRSPSPPGGRHPVAVHPLGSREGPRDPRAAHFPGGSACGSRLGLPAPLGFPPTPPSLPPQTPEGEEPVRWESLTPEPKIPPRLPHQLANPASPPHSFASYPGGYYGGGSPDAAGPFHPAPVAYASSPATPPKPSSPLTPRSRVSSFGTERRTVVAATQKTSLPGPGSYTVDHAAMGAKRRSSSTGSRKRSASKGLSAFTRSVADRAISPATRGVNFGTTPTQRMNRAGGVASPGPGSYVDPGRMMGYLSKRSGGTFGRAKRDVCDPVPQKTFYLRTKPLPPAESPSAATRRSPSFGTAKRFPPARAAVDSPQWTAPFGLSHTYHTARPSSPVFGRTHTPPHALSRMPPASFNRSNSLTSVGKKQPLRVVNQRSATTVQSRPSGSGAVALSSTFPSPADMCLSPTPGEMAWATFVSRCRLEGLGEDELIMLSLDTLKALMKQVNLTDVIDAARVEVHWKQLRLTRPEYT
ncbi:hypothetical protein DIPPA_18453 [Diplonema papillatum]|nr:hypothetical protein DIPPA_18453 [Diplonema papillatum]